jgi:RNAse (barnase) inhibitor barstar
MKAVDEALSQNDLDALFGDLQAEVKKPLDAKEAKNIEALESTDGSLSQNDLDALFGDLQAEVKKPLEVKEVSNIDTLEGNDVLSQDQIDELLKSFSM